MCIKDEKRVRKTRIAKQAASQVSHAKNQRLRGLIPSFSFIKPVKVLSYLIISVPRSTCSLLCPFAGSHSAGTARQSIISGILGAVCPLLSTALDGSLKVGTTRPIAHRTTLIFIFLHAPHLSELRTGPSDRKRGWPSHRYLIRGSDAELLTVDLVRGLILALTDIMSFVNGKKKKRNAFPRELQQLFATLPHQQPLTLVVQLALLIHNTRTRHQHKSQVLAYRG